MSNIEKTNEALTTKGLFSRQDVRQKFEELMGKRAQGFITSVLQLCNSNTDLSACEPMSIYNSAAMAATLDLPLNNNLGFAYIVPYNKKNPDGSFGKVAQFQIGAKGFKQLALRTGQFQTMHTTDIREGEIKSHNRLTGEMEFEWIQDEEARVKAKIIGFVSYFRLLNGFEQTYYMSTAKLEQHGVKYSKTYKNSNSLWKTDFESMAAKTVVKLNLSKNAPLSIEMQRAISSDQAVIKDVDGDEFDYVDHEELPVGTKLTPEEIEHNRVSLLISDSKTVDDLMAIEKFCTTPELKELYKEKSAQF